MAGGRQPYVVDVNVLITANKKSEETFLCAFECAKALLEIRANGKLILDDSRAIFEEYRRYLNFRGQPGLGDKFFKWFIDNSGRNDLCSTVTITRIEHKWRRFAEFPDDDSISDFDLADQMYVAVSVAFDGRAAILQATDHKWIRWSTALEKHGIPVKFLCREDLERVAGNKKKKRA